MSLHEQRRRRFVADEAADDDPPESPPVRLAREDAGSQGEQPAYSSTVAAERQRHVHDLFPSSFLSIGLVTFAALALISMLELAHRWVTPAGNSMTAEAQAFF